MGPISTCIPNLRPPVFEVVQKSVRSYDTGSGTETKVDSIIVPTATYTVTAQVGLTNPHSRNLYFLVHMMDTDPVVNTRDQLYVTGPADRSISTLAHYKETDKFHRGCVRMNYRRWLISKMDVPFMSHIIGRDRHRVNINCLTTSKKQKLTVKLSL
jgi:hypothetical protein